MLPSILTAPLVVRLSELLREHDGEFHPPTFVFTHPDKDHKPVEC